MIFILEHASFIAVFLLLVFVGILLMCKFTDCRCHKNNPDYDPYYHDYDRNGLTGYDYDNFKY